MNDESSPTTFQPPEDALRMASITIVLKEDQLEAVDGIRQPPVVVDPRTGQEYLLIGREEYTYLLRCERAGKGPADKEPTSESNPRDEAAGPLAQRLHVYVKDLEATPELVQAAEDYCRRGKLRKSRYFAEVLNDYKLSHHFGGQTIGYLMPPEGKLILLAGDSRSVEFDEILNQLRHREGKPVQVSDVWKWNDETVVRIG